MPPDTTTTTPTVGDLKTRVTVESYFLAQGSTQDTQGKWRCLCASRHKNGDASHSVTIKNGTARCWSQGCFTDKGADIFAVVGVVEGVPDFKNQKRRVEELAGVNNILRRFRYTDAQGRTAWKIRWNTEEPGKKCTWAQDSEGRTRGKGDCHPTLYELERVMTVPNAVVVEGERDSDTVNGWLVKLGLTEWVATTTPHGASDVKPAYLAPLNGKATVVCSGDNDEAGRGYAEHCGAILHRHVRELRLLLVPDGVNDWSEWAERGATAADFERLLAGAHPWEPKRTNDTTEHTYSATLRSSGPEREKDTDAEVERLASLPRLDYGKARKEAAKRWGVPVSYVDEEVKAKQKATSATDGLALETISPAAYPVDGPVLADRLAASIRRFVVLSVHALHAVVLWLLWTYALSLWSIAPYLAVLSPEKRCGKSTLLALLAKLVDRALLNSNISAAAIFRVIEAMQPTLLIDEMDSFADADEALRGILNSGHMRDAAKAVRVQGEPMEVKVFSTWCPKAFGAIGGLPDTVLNRSIVIPMKRRKKGEPIDKLRWTGATGQHLAHELRTLASECKRWVADHTDALLHASPTMPKALEDRASDNWFVLLCVATVLGPGWLARGEAAALALTGEEIGTSDSMRIQLLTDIRAIINEITKAGKETAIWSQDLCDRLALVEESPWSDWRHGKPITQAQLADQLKPFGVRSRDVKREGLVKKGYPFEDLSDSFDRYLSPLNPENPVSKRYRATSQSGSGDEPRFQSATEEEGSGSKKTLNPALGAESSAVAAQNGEITTGDMFSDHSTVSPDEGTEIDLYDKN